MLMVLFRPERLPKMSCYLAMTVILGLSGIGCSRNVAPAKVYVLDSAPAVTLFIETPTGSNVLIDPGPAARVEQLLFFLKEHNVTQIDHLIVSQVDSSLSGAVSAVSRHYEIQNFYHNKAPSLPKEFRELLTSLKQKNTEIKTLHRHQFISFKDSEIIVLSPNPHEKDVLKSSLALKYIYKKSALIHFGSVDKEGQREMLTMYQKGLKSQIAVLPRADEFDLLLIELLADEFKVLPNDEIGYRSKVNAKHTHALESGTVLVFEMDGHTAKIV